MPIKYGELTIIYPTDTTIFTNVLIWLAAYEKPPNNSKYIFLFDDDEIVDYNPNIHKDLQFNFLDGVFSDVPIYFQKKNKLTTYFYKEPESTSSHNKSLSFKNLFTGNSKYNPTMFVPSVYNIIYTCYKNLSKIEILGIVHLKSNEYMPRFQFAYDTDEFTKEEIIYLIQHIFNHSCV